MMKKWCEYTRQEKAMVVVVIVTLFAVLLSWERVSTGFMKGMNFFYQTPVDTVNRQ